MPESHRPTYPGKIYRLEHAAADGMLVVVRCSLCRRLTRFLAADLVTLLNPRRDALDPPYPCSHCMKPEYLSVRLHLPAPGDYGHLTIRRPAEIVRVQKWKSVKLGD